MEGVVGSLKAWTKDFHLTLVFGAVDRVDGSFPAREETVDFTLYQDGFDEGSRELNGCV